MTQLKLCSIALYLLVLVIAVSPLDCEFLKGRGHICLIHSLISGIEHNAWHIVKAQ